MLPSSVTESHAQLAAAAFAAEHSLELRSRMFDGDTEPEQCAFPIYMLPEGYPEGWWVCLAGRDWEKDPVERLESSTVLAVSKWTGGVRILGSAGDEG